MLFRIDLQNLLCSFMCGFGSKGRVGSYAFKANLILLTSLKLSTLALRLILMTLKFN